MTFAKSIYRTLTMFAMTAACWWILYGEALARGKKEEEPPKATGSWAMAYGLVILGVVLGMLVVCRPSRRRDRSKPEDYTKKDLMGDDEEKK